MARLMSFALTETPLMTGAKDVTRRLGFRDAKVDEWFQAVRKAMGLRKGEQVTRLCMVQMRAVSFEPLEAITPDEVRREGFPEMTPPEFVSMFCAAHRAKRCRPDTEVTRLAFVSTARTIIHVLANGLALCGKAGPPGELWPAAHRWVSFEDPGAHHANCTRCVEALLAMRVRLARPFEEYRRHASQS